MADDLGYGDLGCYGQQHIRTPRIDRMAAQGRRYTQCYSGSTVCAPSRSVLMTGQHTGHTTVRGNNALQLRGHLVPLRIEDVTVAEVLRKAGYATAVTGKWGIGQPGTTGIPTHQGFDRWLGFLDQRRAHHYFVDYLGQDTERLWTKDISGGREQRWAHRLMTDFVLDFIKDNHHRPFFLYVGYTIPHGHYETNSDAPYSDRPWGPGPSQLRGHGHANGCRRRTHARPACQAKD